MIDLRDEASPEKVTEPEREAIYRELYAQEKRIDSLEVWKQEMMNAKSLPVKLDGPGGFSITGNWRFIAGLAILATLIAILYILMRYGK
jgi:hypothetical protein